VATADPIWADVESLPLALFPERLQAMKGEATVVAMPGCHSLSLFPVSTDHEVVGAIEMKRSSP
jgi:hypothetical protein